MICVTNACGQRSENCPTPWACGKYRAEESAYLPRNQALPIMFAEPEPADEFDRTPDADTTQSMFGAWLISIFIGLVVGFAAGAVIFN